MLPIVGIGPRHQLQGVGFNRPTRVSPFSAASMSAVVSVRPGGRIRSLSNSGCRAYVVRKKPLARLSIVKNPLELGTDHVLASAPWQYLERHRSAGPAAAVVRNRSRSLDDQRARRHQPSDLSIAEIAQRPQTLR